MNRLLPFLLAGAGIILAFEAKSLGQNKNTDPADLISYQASFLVDDPFHEFNQTGKKIQVRRGRDCRSACKSPELQKKGSTPIRLPSDPSAPNPRFDAH